MDGLEPYYRLGLATVIGLLIGAERGWHTREQSSGERVAGVRTFALVGILGGVTGLLADFVGIALPAVAFLAVTALVVTSYRADMRTAGADRGMTTEIALLVTFALGTYIVVGDMMLGAAAAVVVVTLLQVKPQLHYLVKEITRLELDGAIRLLVISVVLLPLLPDRGIGPGGSVNPFELWLMVVLVSGLSFAGYIAIKLAGPGVGTMMTGVLGGLASSTALTVSFSRFSRRDPALAPLLARGVGLAMGVMLVRVVAIAGAVDWSVAVALAAPLGAAAAAILVATLLLAHAPVPPPKTAPAAEVSDPCDLMTALKFGLFLLAITLVAHYVRQRFGTESLYILALVAGLADVDAITLTFARAGYDADTHEVAVIAIALATASNSVVKLGIAATIGSGGLAKRIAILIGAGLAAGVGATVVF